MEELFRPTLQPFLDTTTPYGEARIAIAGAPLDLTGSYRRGTRFAPEAIRQASQYMDTYSPRTGLDMDDLSFADLGNLKLSEGVETSLSVIEEAVKSIHGSGRTPMLLGGEHTATLGVLRALKPDLVVDFDAHLDLRDRLMGLEMSHATFMRRAMEELDFRLVVLGSRALSREELDFVEENPDRISMVNSTELRKDVEPSLKTARGWLEDASSVYLSIDMDVLDPAVAPAVGNPSRGDRYDPATRRSEPHGGRTPSRLRPDRGLPPLRLRPHGDPGRLCRDRDNVPHRVQALLDG
jgi:agmatinase